MWRVVIAMPLIFGAVSASGLTLRSDLDAPLSKLICSKKASAPPPTSELWKHGIFDAGAHVYILSATKKAPNSLSNLEPMAKSFADESHHLGYTFGSCSKFRHWVATTPSPMNLSQKAGVFRLSARRVRSYCQWFRIDYAHAKHGKPRRLFKSKKGVSTKNIAINTGLLERGSLSVTCKPRHPKWLGPVLWSLQPVKEGPLDKPLLTQQLSMKKRDGALHTWINRVRQDMGLNTLDTASKPFAEITKPLISQNLSIQHHRGDIRKVSKGIKEQNGKFLGENRVQAKSFEEAAWLLWNSPRHRSLLLNSKATHLATLGKRLKSEELSVMVFAKF
jgi:hypothetical protein